MSVRPSVCMEKLSSHWTEFDKIWYLSFFQKSVRKSKFHWNLTRITGTLHEDIFTSMIISRWILTIRNVLGKSCSENQNTHSMFNNFFLKVMLFMIYVEKYGAAREATEDKMVHACVHTHARARAHTHTHTHREIYITYYLSTATVVLWMCLIVTLYMHCLSCFLLPIIPIWCLWKPQRWEWK
jgi:hypothetical protein